MATAVVSIICIALIVLGGMTMSQGILSSADATALSVEEISMREGEIMRTELDAVRAAHLSWADLLRVTLDNSGQTKLASFSKWDCIVNYYDGDGAYYTEWLPYTDGALSDNEWRKARIGLNGPTEYFEPGLLNPEEDLVILAKLNPLPGEPTTGEIIVSTANGIADTISFSSLDYTLLTAHSEDTAIAVTDYYQLAEATPADGAAMTETTYIIGRRQAGRWLLHNQADDTRLAKHVFSLTGISQIPAATWTVYYRGQAWGTWWGGWRGNASLSIDIIIRQADGSIRQTIATDVAEAILTNYYNWETVSATYNFLGYTVVDDSDYLEIDYYANSSGWGPFWNSYIRLRVDDSTLPEADQTRIEA